ncbi:MAG: TIM barrel protein, partial [Clostridia bacterium]|nr:TIM barrel protein [Clostridia bacterium]
MVFGVAGVPTNYKGKFKDLFAWLKEMGLNGYEIQCVYGFKMSDVNKQIYLSEQQNGFNFSIHAPYYINLGSLSADVVARSKANMKDGIALAKSVGVNRIIFHPGGGHENTEQGRKVAVKQLIDAINEFTSEIDMGDVRLYPEIGGKTASLGSLDEIIEICTKCKFCYPCIDIAHLHARDVGSIVSADGEVIAVMDCDLQHPPEILIEMYRLYQEGYEVIEGVKSNRGTESFLHRKLAGLFYQFMTKATGIDMQNASDFKMLSKKAVRSILSLPERNMFFRATSSWVGYKTTSVSFEVQKRQAGKSKWNSGSLVKYAFNNIVSFTTAPMQFVTIGGGICLVFSIILAIYSLIMKFSG